MIDSQLNPAWLNSPPDTFPSPPVITRVQTLPFRELSWENFERLILRIVRRETTVTECWTYGKRGQEQYGLDILAILAEFRNACGKFICYQCKRVEKFSATDINKAVDKFLQGKWALKTKRFVLCTSLQLTDTQQIDEISRQKIALAEKGIEFETWDDSEGGQLSERLKRFPDLVDDFFGREWVRLFNGQNAADSLGERLDGENLAELRAQLRNIYLTLFHRNDQGIRLKSGQTIPLLERYVSPSVIETKEIFATERIASENIVSPKDHQYSEGRYQQTPNRPNRMPTIQEIRMPVGDWFSRHNRSVILGEPGYGKSILLRIIAMQLLNCLDEPFPLSWYGLLPVWISFGGFSAAIQNQNNLNLEDYFDQWLHQHNADHVRQLFRRAVRNGEILLLIDGLDEGQNSHSAQKAMDILSTFLSSRPIPAIFTSRPRGYTQVCPDGGWPLARLASFEEAQIECFARIWFKHLEVPIVDSGKEDNWSECNTEQRKDEFLKAIRANSHVMDLARTPLFCQLLIDVFRFSHHLPEQRIKVYEKVIELLLSDHPLSRARAAGLPHPMDIPRTDDMREMLMRLALHIQVHGGAGVISVKDCQTVFCDFLTDDINGPGYSPYEARHKAKAVIEYAQTGLGLVVERASNELGFFHLTVQEYLAAQAMVRKEENEQLNWLSDVWSQPRWHEVVLAWFGIMGSEHGKGITQRAIDHLKQTATGHLMQIQLLRLRTELSSGDLGLSPREARATIEEAANQVETTPFSELRQELAGYITLGLRSPSVAKQCEERIANWVPAFSEWKRAGLLEVFDNWQASEDLLHILKLALHDESVRCRWAAAKSLAKSYASDPTVGDFLAKLAAKCPDTGVKAAALYGLEQGWHHHYALNDLSDIACCSTDMDLALAGIAIRVANARQDITDRQRIWSMLSNGSVSYGIRDFCREVLIQGWSKDEEIKHSAIESLRDRLQHSRRLEEEQILSFLAESWSGDTEVGCCIARWFAGVSPTFLLDKQNTWKHLFRSFRSNNDLASALRGTLSDQKSKYKNIFWGPDTKWAYCVIGDDAAKTDVLEAYASANDYIGKLWVISTLMEAWPDDKDVKDLLIREFNRFPGEVAFISSWIDSVISAPEKRRKWLLEAVRQSGVRFAATPIVRLLDEFNDEECLEAVLAVLEKNIWYYNKIEIQNQLIMKFPHIPQIRQWAESSFFEIEGPSLICVATAYKQDQYFRDRLLRATRPAKANVRAEVFRIFREHSIPKDSGLRLTENIWIEEDGTVRTSGVVARCIMASPNLEAKASLMAKLNEEIKSIGPYYEMRRRAAFAGLLQLKEYTTCIEATEEKSPSSLHWLADFHKSDVIMTRMIFDHWEKLHEASLLRSCTFEIPWWEIISGGAAREAYSNSTACAKLIDYLKSMEPQNRSSESLALMAELMPNSAELRACLIESIKNPNLSYSSIEALRIYIQQFGDDEHALIELRKLWNIADEEHKILDIHPLFLYALIIGWPQSPLLRPYLEQQELPKDFPLITALALSGINGDENLALACIDRLIQISVEKGRALPDAYSLCLRDWARSPCAEKPLRRLINDLSPSCKISAIRLLSNIGKLTDEDRMMLKREFDEGIEDATKFGADGIDLVNRKVTTLSKVIFSLLFK